MDILGHKLIVEFSKKRQQNLFPTELKQLKLGDIKEKGNNTGKEDGERQKKEEAEKEKLRVAREINQMSERFGMEYPLNPRLQYVYPPPTVTVLTNIANALASVPKFYVQVLHLMNKMNLPPPFGAIMVTPPLTEEPKPSVVESERQEPDRVEAAEMEMSSEEESELESEDEAEVQHKNISKFPTAAVKRTKRHGLDKPRKRQKLHLQQASMTTSRTAVQKVEEVFEVPQASGAKKAEFKLTPTIGIPSQSPLGPSVTSEESKQSTSVPDPGGSDVESGNKPIMGWDIQVNADLLSITEPKTVVEEGGFGKLEPVVKATEEEPEEEEEEEWGATEFISSRKLRRNRITHSEMRDISAFRNYQEGEPTSRLYIKNISRQATDKDLHYVFGKYVDWEDEAQKLVFDIRLMKEGKMKGQAFVTLPNAERALDALSDTHGFMLKGKPIVVQFARSAKPKEKDNKDKKEKTGKS